MSKYEQLAELFDSAPPEKIEVRNAEGKRVRRSTLAGRMAAQIAHDLNNPLQGIMLYGELGESETQEDDPFHEYFSGIVECAEQLQALTLQLRAFADKEIE